MYWNVPKRDIVNKRVVIKYADISQQRAKDSIFNQLGTPVFIDGASSQARAFSAFLEKEIEAFEDARVGAEDQVYKPNVEFTELSVHKSQDKFFLICSESVVFVLNSDGQYSKKLTSAEIEGLDFSIVWLGPQLKVQFEANDQKAVESVLSIVDNVNRLQPNDDFYGFPLASIVSHLRGFLYQEILDEQTCFYTTITVSGEQRGTGKSLLFAINQSLLYGTLLTADKHISEAMLYKKLAGMTEEGKVPVYVNEWDGSSMLFNNAVTGIWEASARTTSTGSYKPK